MQTPIHTVTIHLPCQIFHKRWRLYYTSGWFLRCSRTLVWYKEHSSAWYFQQNLSHQILHINKEMLENLVPVSYCRATPELQNGGWIMGIGPSESKRTTFYARHSLWVLANSMHRNVHCRTHGCLWVMGLEWEESRRFALSADLCLES